MEHRMRIRLEKISDELLESSYSGETLSFRTALRADGVTNGWKIGFLYKGEFGLDVMIIPEDQDDDEIRDQIKVEIDRNLPAVKKRASA